MKTVTRTVVVTAVVLAGVAVGGVLTAYERDHVNSSPPGSPSISPHAEENVIDTCQDSVRKMLKDPDSARFNDWTASEGGAGPPAWMGFNPEGSDRYYSASGTVNAKNGFGGYTGDEQYSCDAVVTSGTGTVRAQARSGV
jgi:hypothetical protein